MHPDDKYKAEFDRKKAELKDNSGEEILKKYADDSRYPTESCAKSNDRRI